VLTRRELHTIQAIVLAGEEATASPDRRRSRTWTASRSRPTRVSGPNPSHGQVCRQTARMGGLGLPGSALDVCLTGAKLSVCGDGGWRMC